MTDEVKPDWDLAGAVEDLRLLFEVGYRVAMAIGTRVEAGHRVQGETGGNAQKGSVPDRSAYGGFDLYIVRRSWYSSARR